MECKNCGTENEENAVFCKNCGKRLDGKIKCPACGVLVSEGGKFCIRCGKELTPPEEVVSETAVSASVDKTPAINNVAKQVNWERVAEIASAALILLAALIAFGFVFGMSVILKSGSGSSAVSETSYLYDYFGKVYKETVSGAEDYYYYNKVASIVNKSGTVISAVGLFAVVAAAAVTVFCAVKKLIYKNKVNFEKPAIITYLCYVAFATVYVGFHSASVKLLDIEAACGDITTAGLVLSSICFSLYLAIKIARQIIADKSKKSLINITFAVVAIILASIAAGLLSGPAIGASVGSSGSLVEVSVDMSFSVILSTLTQIMGVSYCASADALLKTASAGIVLGGLLAISVGLLLYCLINSVNNKLTVVTSVASLGLSVGYLVCAILSFYKFKTALQSLQSSATLEASFGTAIGLVIITALICISVLVKLVILKVQSGDKSTAEEKVISAQ